MVVDRPVPLGARIADAADRLYDLAYDARDARSHDITERLLDALAELGIEVYVMARGKGSHPASANRA